jgi:type I restriction enzyme S subunit
MTSKSIKIPIEKCLLKIIDNRGKTPPLSNIQTPYPLIEINAIVGQNKYPNLNAVRKFVSDETYNSWFRAGHPKNGDILFSTVGSIAEVAIIRGLDVCIAQNIIALRVNPEVVDSDYFYYLLIDPVTRAKLKTLDISSVQPSIKVPHLLATEVFILEPSEQIEVVKILGAIDDRITLLRENNSTLELITKALFKYWFIDFGPVHAKQKGIPPEGMDEETDELFSNSFEQSELGFIPKGWRVSNIGEIAEVIDCLHSKKPNLIPAGKIYLQLNNIKDDGTIDIENLFYISNEDYQKWTSRIEVKTGDCIITNVGRVGAVAQIPRKFNAAIGRNITAIRPKTDYPYPTFLIKLLLSSVIKSEILDKTDSGTILDALNVRNIPKLKFIVPPDSVLRKYELLCRPLREKVELNLENIYTLNQLRDSLLPRLMQGKLTIKKIEQIKELA